MTMCGRIAAARLARRHPAERNVSMSPNWDRVTCTEVLHAIQEYDRLGPEAFFSAHGFAPTTTYELVWDDRRYTPKAILGTAYEFATGQRLASGDFEGGKAGAVKVLGKLGFTSRNDDQPAESGVAVERNWESALLSTCAPSGRSRMDPAAPAWLTRELANDDASGGGTGRVVTRGSGHAARAGPGL
jgi:hypothetical protein